MLIMGLTSKLYSDLNKNIKSMDVIIDLENSFETVYYNLHNLIKGYVTTENNI